MISPEEFYSASERPTPSVKKNLWNRIEQTLPKREALVFAIQDRRSFIYGMAASIVLYLSVAGGLSVLRQVRESSQTPETRFDKAYQSAIREFEAVVPPAVQGTTTGHRKLQSQEQQLRLVDDAIVDLRADITRRGPSPVTSAKLRELYSLKLQILQTMIENGEVEL